MGLELWYRHLADRNQQHSPIAVGSLRVLLHAQLVLGEDTLHTSAQEPPMTFGQPVTSHVRHRHPARMTEQTGLVQVKCHVSVCKACGQQGMVVCNLPGSSHPNHRPSFGWTIGIDTHVSRGY